MTFNVEWGVIAFVFMIILALVTTIYRIYDRNQQAHWNAIDKRATAEALQVATHQSERALEQLRTDSNERLREMQRDYAERIEQLATRQDREVDALKAEMSRVTQNLGELRRDVAQGNLNIMDRLQEVTLLLRAPGAH